MSLNLMLPHSSRQHARAPLHHSFFPTPLFFPSRKENATRATYHYLAFSRLSFLGFVVLDLLLVWITIPISFALRQVDGLTFAHMVMVAGDFLYLSIPTDHLYFLALPRAHYLYQCRTIRLISVSLLFRHLLDKVQWHLSTVVN
ncbi:hypothetical protein EDB85DRAFT_1941204 [Lactarius pseudohatsudake]|nr:hypothetical protein EDB85DRAFT_1941204 [Lactarius pseudohatsudake]